MTKDFCIARRAWYRRMTGWEWMSEVESALTGGRRTKGRREKKGEGRKIEAHLSVGLEKLESRETDV